MATHAAAVRQVARAELVDLANELHSSAGVLISVAIDLARSALGPMSNDIRMVASTLEDMRAKVIGMADPDEPVCETCGGLL